MNEVKFFLKDQNAKSKSLIMASLFIGKGQRIKISTGISIPPNMWNDKKKSIKTGYFNQLETNKLLFEFSMKIQNLFTSLEQKHGKGLVTSLKFKEAYQNLIESDSDNKLDLIQTYKRFLIYKSKMIGVNSIKTYNTTLMHLNKFQEHEKIVINYQQLNEQFHQDYSAFCFDSLKLAPNTVGRDMKNLKSFINYLKVKGLGKNLDTKNFKSISVPSFSIALTEEELDKIYNLDLSDNSRLNQVRIKFLLACYTGMRIGDLFRVSAGNITENTFEYVQGKTGEKVYLPRHDALNKILALLPKDYHLPTISEQRYNQYLKEVCLMADITEEIKVPKYEGRNKVFISKKKYELVTSHTARKTFATIGITKGIPAETLMKFTGHDDLVSFLKYVKMPPNLYMDVIRNAWSKK